MVKNEKQVETVTHTLRVRKLDGKQCIGSFVPDKDQQVVFGSCTTADVVLPGEKVASIHAMLRITKNGEVVLYDLGSKSGTLVEGKRIIQSAVQPGTKFEIGGHKFQVELVSHDPKDAPEQKLFWEARGENCHILDVAMLVGGKLDSLFQLGPNQKLRVGHDEDEVFFEGLDGSAPLVERRRLDGDRNQEGAYCFLPMGFRAEVYDARNQLVGNVDKAGEYFCIGERQKAKLISESIEVQVYWRSQESRMDRGTPDAETKRFKESVSVSMALSTLILAIMYFMPKSVKEEELAESKKGSYFRVTQVEPTQAPAPAPAAAPMETVTQVVEKQAVAQPKTVQQTVQKVVTPEPPKPSKSTVASLSSLSNLLNRTNTKNVSVGERGRKVVEAAIVPVSSGASGLKTDIGGQAQAGSVNTSALTQALQAGAQGAVAGLKGFKGGSGLGAGSSFGNGPPSMDVGLGDSDAETTGGLDKSVIAAIVREHLGQIKHCYERQLLVDANLFGKVVANWSINPDGMVDETSVKKSTMGNAAVENCVLGKIKTWKFPKPRGGGKVIVSYPFLFKSVN